MKIKTMRHSLLAVTAALFVSAQANADFIVDTAEAYDLVDQYGQPVSADGVASGLPVTNEMLDEGYYFSPFVFYNPDPFFFGAPTQVGNFSNVTSEHLETFTIAFPAPVTDAGFLYWAPTDSVTEFTTYLNGNVVEATALVNPSLDPPRVLAFVNTRIDAIEISVGSERVILDFIFSVPDESEDPCDPNGDGASNIDDLVFVWEQCKADNQGTPGWVRRCLITVIELNRQCRGSGMTAGLGTAFERQAFIEKTSAGGKFVTPTTRE